MTASANSKLHTYNCWEVWVDNGDGTETRYPNVCEDTGEQTLGAVPWRYSMRISMIHAGTTAEEVVTSLDGRPGSSIEAGDTVPDFISLTNFDATVETGIPKADEPPISYRNPQHPPIEDHLSAKVSAGSPIYLNSLSITFDTTPNILTETPSFNFAVVTGDTIIVRARKQGNDAGPQFLDFTIAELALSATLFINGTAVTPVGSQGSTKDDMAGFTFSYTVP